MKGFREGDLGELLALGMFLLAAVIVILGLFAPDVLKDLARWVGMKPSALDVRGEMPVLFSDRDVPAHCVFCGRLRPLELLATWMCSRCKVKPLWELFPMLHPRTA